MITYDIDEALSLGTKVVVMSRSPGRILKEFPANFTYRARDNKYGIAMGKEYMAIKEEILEIIGH